jgi:DNA-binding response OmpR family regulator
VDAAGSATEAMNKIGLVPGGVDAVVIDVGLPDRRGDTLVFEMRAIYPTLPVVLSGQNAADLRERFKDEARMAFVTKPYTANNLVAALRTIGLKPARPQ